VKSRQGLTIERLVELGQVSRSGFYRFSDGVKAGPGPDPDMDLRAAIQRIALEWPSYGRKVNPKRVHRIMREDHLLCVRQFLVTTDSNHRC
jgi:putative transposase